MGWITTKDGRRVNTDWFKDSDKQKYAQFNVPYEKWEHKPRTHEEHYDAETPYTVQEEDESRWVNEKDIRKVGKAGTIKDIEAWKNDDGTYGTGDESIHVIYDDGSVVELTDGDIHRGWKTKQGIRGLSISTGDYEQVWGDEYYSRSKEWRPLTTTEWDEDDNPVEGYSNSYSGVRATGEYKVRKRITSTLNKEKNKWETKHDILSMSTVRRYGADTSNASAFEAATKTFDRLSKKGISNSWEIESWIRGLSPTRKNNLAKELGIAGVSGEEKIKLMVSRIFGAGKG